MTFSYGIMLAVLMGGAGLSEALIQQIPEGVKSTKNNAPRLWTRKAKGKVDVMPHKVHSVSRQQKKEKHMELYEDAEAVLKQLPAGDARVHAALSRALNSVRRADAAVLAMALDSAETVKIKPSLRSGSTQWASIIEAQGLFSVAVSCFLDANDSSPGLTQTVLDRKGELLPSLREQASTDISQDVTEAARNTRIVINTPDVNPNAKSVAYRLMAVVRQAKKDHMKLIFSGQLHRRTPVSSASPGHGGHAGHEKDVQISMPVLATGLSVFGGLSSASL
mmetsp:Transcript_58805/g.127214  ORF Transcript_58805/g.127214 Transcript_58805/m.127214 type:complete len:278 (-) Transcript_58805:216-1049(-)|eukprot:CAMPEP_0170599962 /NCGR_PEP_ID=MMETSP0224-20130122/17082_1 /TAXON_ID=285029 /ORGANISM="Togula jolla, Strain CCCM 725" /LENGTH=277 /DNA_ID=CAMNT_0010924659 /DNA_START=72 /DNA_END=905 /DNA_ORIENTATION=+